MLLSIVSGTYNRLPYLTAMMKSCTASLPPGLEYEFCICDGGSTDGTLEYLRGRGDVKLLEHGELRGAIRAFNDAAATASGDYLLIANDDIEVMGYSIAKGLAFMLDNPDVGAGCFFQDRGNKALHVEKMPMVLPNGSNDWLPYMQVGIIPKWLWDKCGGWGDWGGRTYGGDNYLSLKVYESGYKVIAMEGCSIKDKTPIDELREINNTNNTDGKKLWAAFPGGTRIPDYPIYENPLPGRKRVLYAPIIETGHTVQKAQKCGLREALKDLGLVWEVDYVYSKESIVEAAEAWKPHFTITQIHHADAVTMDEIKRVKESTLEWMVNWNGDVWQQTQSDPRYLEFMRYFDYQLCVNAALFPVYKGKGVNAEYWQNSFEPQVIEGDEAPERHDIIFLGNRYSDYREDLARAIKSLPFDVAIYGRGYVDGNSQPVMVNGQELSLGESLYDYRKTGGLYRGAKIAVADNQYPEATAFASDRLFMILAAGGCMMMHQRVHQMEEYLGLVDGVHYVSFTDLDDLKAKTTYYLTHEEERQKIAEAGTRECRTNHTFKKRVQELVRLIEKLPSKTRKKTVSACMIVKNEYANIEGCLMQLSKFADEIIVVDTGSTDGTLEFLREFCSKEFAIKLYEFPWCDDFAEARNFAKSKATSDYIFWMDADDELDEFLIAKMKIFSEWKYNRIGVTNPQAFRFLCVGMKDGEEQQAGFQVRLFQNLEGIKWESRVHETVDESLGVLGITPITYRAMKIRHLGTADAAKIAAKQEYYIRLLKMDPMSVWTAYQIGSSYSTMGRFGDAMVWFEKSKRLGDVKTNRDFADFLDFCCGHCLYQMGLREEAKAWLQKSHYLDALFLLAEIERDDGAFRADLYRRFLAERLPENLPTFATIWQPMAKDLLLQWHKDELAELVK